MQFIEEFYNGGLDKSMFAIKIEQLEKQITYNMKIVAEKPEYLSLEQYGQICGQLARMIDERYLIKTMNDSFAGGYMNAHECFEE